MRLPVIRLLVIPYAWGFVVFRAFVAIGAADVVAVSMGLAATAIWVCVGLFVLPGSRGR